VNTSVGGNPLRHGCAVGSESPNLMPWWLMVSLNGVLALPAAPAPTTTGSTFARAARSPALVVSPPCIKYLLAAVAR
jgi:hypothetical protein